MTGMTSVGLLLRRDFFSPVQRDQFIIDVYAPQGSSLAHTLDVVEADRKAAQRDAGSHQLRLVRRPQCAAGVLQPVGAGDVRQPFRPNRRQRDRLARIGDDVAQRVQQQLAVESSRRALRRPHPRARRAVRRAVRSANHRPEPGNARRARPPRDRRARRHAGRAQCPRQLRQRSAAARRRKSTSRWPARSASTRAQWPTSCAIASTASWPATCRKATSESTSASAWPVPQRDDIADLNAVYFKPTADAPLIPFSSVATLEPSWEAASIYRRDGQRTLSVLAYPEFGLTAAQVSKRFTPQLAATGGQHAARLRARVRRRERAAARSRRQLAQAKRSTRSASSFCCLIAQFHSFLVAGDHPGRDSALARRRDGRPVAHRLPAQFHGHHGHDDARRRDGHQRGDPGGRIRTAAARPASRCDNS